MQCPCDNVSVYYGGAKRGVQGVGNMIGAIKHHDLGVLDGPVLIFGGPHSNAQALAGVIRAAQNLAIPAERMICTGDVVAYCGAPVRSVAQIRAVGLRGCGGQLRGSIGQLCARLRPRVRGRDGVRCAERRVVRFCHASVVECRQNMDGWIAGCG